MIRTVVQWFKRAHGTHAAIISALAYISGVVVNLVTADPDGGPKFWFLIVGGMIACGVLALGTNVLASLGKADCDRVEREHATHRSGYNTLNREIGNYISYAKTLAPGHPDLPDVPRKLMMKACEDLYEVLEAEYGNSGSVSDHIAFEVTFMTHSLVDGEITVAAWANRDGRAPKSLSKRQAEPKIYEGTETDQLFKDPNRTSRFISSTEGTAYRELYPSQKMRIKSSVVWPVLDQESGLHGTLVAHCDEVGFFDGKHEKLWRETLEPYTKRLALARVLANRIHASGHNPGF